MPKQSLKLSPSTLNLFRECPRCFWLQMRAGIHRPRGIFPSLPGGMDEVLKVYYDAYREKGTMPPEIRGKVRGALFSDQDLMDRWRNWRAGLAYEDKPSVATLVGALDECLVDGSFYIPLDFKTRGSEPKEGASERYYGNQLNCYALLLKENGYRVRDFAYLVYYYPKAVKPRGTVEFVVKVVEIKVNPEDARATLRSAAQLLRGKEPKRHSACEYCSWNERISAEFD